MERGIGELPSTLSDRYDLVEVIGSGGMAVVWLADDRALGRQVAVKVLSARVADDPSFLRRFQREARHIASMSHPNIVKVYDLGVDGDLSFIVMEYVEGRSLGQVFDSATTLSCSETADLAVATLSALEHAHDRGIVHRDVKPGNILVSLDGSARVADFGVAKSVKDTTELTIHGSFVGTVTYASPEQLLGRPVGRATDLYSLGCVLYQCLAGRPPFEADDVERLVLQHRFAEVEPIELIRPEVPEQMASAITRALEKDPAKRWASAQDMRRPFDPAAGAGLTRIASSGVKTVTDRHLSDTIVQERRMNVTRSTGLPAPLHPVESRGGEDGGFLRQLSAPLRRHRRATALILLTALLVTVSLIAWGPGRGTGPTTPLGSTIPSGGFLQPGQTVHSSNHLFRLSMQTDGNLVLYGQTGTRPLWQSGTSGNFGAYAVMQSDGDFVVYPEGLSAPAPGQPTHALWSSGTYGHSGSSLVLRNDGEAVLRRAGNGGILWESNIQRPPG